MRKRFTFDLAGLKYEVRQAGWVKRIESKLKSTWLPDQIAATETRGRFSIGYTLNESPKEVSGQKSLWALGAGYDGVEPRTE